MESRQVLIQIRGSAAGPSVGASLLAKKRQDTALFQGTHVIVDDLREQARSYKKAFWLSVQPA
jgi:hypothetical protein